MRRLPFWPLLYALSFSAWLVTAQFAGDVAVQSSERTGDHEITLHRVEPGNTDAKKLTDELMAPYSGGDSPGAAVQVWRDGRTLYSKAYGMANLTYDIPFETDTRTNLGSTSKQFTAFAIMLQAERGLLSLDDDIREHIPELPECDETITVRHLLTHTSGLRAFLNLLLMTGRRLDHGDWIDRSEIIDIVRRQPALQNAPGAEMNYNNSAFGLAAVIVKRTSGQDFHVFLQENVFGPLGMTRTMVRPSPEYIVPGMSEGYVPSADGFRQIGDLGGAVGAGGIYSTVEDLQTWVQNYASPRVGSAEIFDQMMTSYVLTNGDETGYGYGLSINEHRGLRAVHHGGADIGHRSMLVYYPEINAGITVQSNHAQFDSNIWIQIAEAFFADAMESQDDEAKDTGEGTFSIASVESIALVEAYVLLRRNERGDADEPPLNLNGQNYATSLDDDEAAAWEPTALILPTSRGGTSARSSRHSTPSRWKARRWSCTIGAVTTRV